jgi:Mn-dependent DtxR family transcriptional regulator
LSRGKCIIYDLLKIVIKSNKGKKEMALFESAEDYLERILMLTNRNGSVKSIDIANDMNFSKPSISRAMKKLKTKRYIRIEKSGNIILTSSGMKKASEILERHVTLTNILVSLGVNKKTAAEDACKIEHDLSADSFSAIKRKYNENNT